MVTFGVPRLPFRSRASRLVFPNVGNHVRRRFAFACSLDTWKASICRVGSSAQRAMRAQGLPWERHSKVRSPEGATGLQGLSVLSPGAPSGPQAIDPKTQGKPWAKLSRPFGPDEPRARSHKLSSARLSQKSAGERRTENGERQTSLQFFRQLLIIARL
jgi:hypothetical protein